MINDKNDVEELEELLTELEGAGAEGVAPYEEDDDVVTQMMEPPVDDEERMTHVPASGAREEPALPVAAAPLPPAPSPSGPSRALPPPSAPAGLAPASRQSAALPPPPSVPRSVTPLPPPPRLPPAPAWSGGDARAGAAPQPIPPAASPPAPPSAARELPQFGPAPLPPPAATPVSRPNTTRPVAIDFNPTAPAPSSAFRTVFGSGAAALLTIVVTSFALSAGGVFEPAAEVSLPSAAPAPAGAEQAAGEATPEPAPSAPASGEIASATDEPSAPEGSMSDQVAADVSAKADGPAAEAPATENEPSPRADAPTESPSVSSEPTAPEPKVEPEARRESRKPKASRRVRRTAERQVAAAAKVIKAPEAPAPEAPAPEAPAPEAPAPEVAPEAAKAPPVKSTSSAESSQGTFNLKAAKAALGSAALQVKNCRPAGGPTGSGRVQLRYAPSGKVTNVTVLTPAFVNSAAEGCIKMLFRRASAPAFAGVPSVVLTEGFEIP